MISAFFREQRRYTHNELCEQLQCSEEKLVSVIRKLKEFGILKAVKKSDVQRDLSELLDEDIEITDVEVRDNRFFYVFTFVGVIVVEGRVLKCYPKYLVSKDEPVSELKQVLKVLEKFNSKEQIVQMYSESDENSSFNLLAVYLYLIQDYYANGIYNDIEDIVEVNGTGEILWDGTINETFALIYNNRPYYAELQTKKLIKDDYNYFKRLHECILTKASKEMEQADLLDIFEITEIDLTDEDLDEFGDKEYIMYRIENELNQQFNTRKQIILKTIYVFIANSGTLFDIDGISIFGTNHFNIVWEKIFADILDNQLEIPLGAIKLPVPLAKGYNRKTKLIDLIEKPTWTFTGKTAKDTLIPDLITIHKAYNKYYFIIFDAKYYNARLVEGVAPTGQPGIESIIKQYIYQLAYQQFIKDHKFSSVINCFLLPTENNEVEEKGMVEMKIFSSLDLQNILVRFVPAVDVYDLYLFGQKMSIDYLKF